MRFSTPLVFAGFFSLTTAHFQLIYPPTRGFDEPKEIDFCGGFPLDTSRTQFPMNDAFVSLTTEHPTGDITVRISLDNNPSTFDEFNKTSGGMMLPAVVPFTVMSAAGQACLPVNITRLDIPGADNGTNATLLVEVDGPDGKLFQCADIVLSANAKVPSGTSCQNATGAFPNDSGDSTGPIASIFLVAGTSILAALGLTL